MASTKKTEKTSGPVAKSPTDGVDGQANLLSAAPRQVFLTEAASPFKDGYSIQKEQEFLAEFVAAGASETSPLYDRYIELMDRQDRFVELQAQREVRKGVDPLVRTEEARQTEMLGSLVDEAVDTLEIHTLQGLNMFMGRAREEGKQAAPIIGGRRTASALRHLWLMTINDNPYADWALIRHEQSMRELAKRLASDIEKAESLLGDKRKLGLNYSVMVSANPQKLRLGFRSPFGYAIAELIASFDYFVRVQTTLAYKGIRTDDQKRQGIAEITRYARRVWNETTRFERWLNRDEMRLLSRHDFVPEAGEEARKRVEFALEMFGPVDGAVFSGVLQPSHSRRRRNITQEELALLQRIGKGLDNQTAALEAQGHAEEVADAGAAEKGKVALAQS